MSKLQIISNKNTKSIKLKRLVFKEAKKFEKQFQNIAIVIGGWIYASNFKKIQTRKNVL